MVSTTGITEITDILADIAVEAGKKVLGVYETDFTTYTKEDQTPITMADRQSHQYICSRLGDVSVGNSGPLPVLSEEGRSIPYGERRVWEAFWLVDPLDGTKEFVKRNGEFTVNIALIAEGKPLAGFVYVPVKDVLYYGIAGSGAYTCTGSSLENSRSLPLEETQPAGKTRIMASRSHRSSETEEFINKLKQQVGDVHIISAGSSLKLCRVAEGSVDIYPRFGPTMEWDTAAAHAVCGAAGCIVVNPHTKTELQYNKENLVNPHFIVFRDPKFANLF